jgi:DNA replication protein DnaC
MLIALKKSGLEDCINEYRFDNFKTDMDYRKQMYELSQKYVNQDKQRFLYLSGQPGCGKTHLGTAICGYHVDRGESMMYVIHSSMLNDLKANLNDDEYAEILRKYGGTSRVYLDDFFKPTKDERGNTRPPTASDIARTFEVINLRAVKNLTTVITSERSLEDIIQLDEALGSRIKQRCGEFAMEISRKEGRNYRLG